MLKFKDNKFISIKKSSLKDQEILERYNLQQAIIDSWDQFKNEIGMPDILYVGQEVNPHTSVENRIDILAFHPNDNIPIVIELKRGKNKLQLLQSISYASMVSKWSDEDYIKIAEENNSPDLEDIRSSLSDFDTDSVRIVLLAEKFDPEVIISSDWLYREHNLDIIACSINVYKNEDEVFFSFAQKYPLGELEDSYVERSRRKTGKSTKTYSEVTWEEVKEKLSYNWGSELIDICMEHLDGDPSRRRFGQIIKKFDGMTWISLNMRQHYVNVYIKGKPEEGADFFQEKFRDDIEISDWRDGWSFLVKTQRHYEDLLKWLPFNKAKKKVA